MLRETKGGLQSMEMSDTLEMLECTLVPLRGLVQPLPKWHIVMEAADECWHSQGALQVAVVWAASFTDFLRFGKTVFSFWIPWCHCTYLWAPSKRLLISCTFLWHLLYWQGLGEGTWWLQTSPGVGGRGQKNNFQAHQFLSLAHATSRGELMLAWRKGTTCQPGTCTYTRLNLLWACSVTKT